MPKPARKELPKRFYWSEKSRRLVPAARHSTVTPDGRYAESRGGVNEVRGAKIRMARTTEKTGDCRPKILSAAYSVMIAPRASLGA